MKLNNTPYMILLICIFFFVAESCLDQNCISCPNIKTCVVCSPNYTLKDGSCITLPNQCPSQDQLESIYLFLLFTGIILGLCIACILVKICSCSKRNCRKLCNCLTRIIRKFKRQKLINQDNTTAFDEIQVPQIKNQTFSKTKNQAPSKNKNQRTLVNKRQENFVNKRQEIPEFKNDKRSEIRTQKSAIKNKQIKPKQIHQEDYRNYNGNQNLIDVDTNEPINDQYKQFASSSMVQKYENQVQVEPNGYEEKRIKRSVITQAKFEE